MSDPPTSETKPPIANPPIAIGKAGSRRRRGLLWLTSVVIVAGAAYGSWWFLYGRYYESTDDSYVNGDLVQITSEVPGTVIKVAVDDTQSVRRGQPLIELDPADAQVAMDSAKADLARAVRRVRTLFAQAEELRAQIAEREIALKRAEDDYARRAQLAGDGAVSEEELSHTKDAIIQLQASLTAAREQLAATTAQIDGTTIRTHPDVLSASAMLRNASLALSRTDIVAPVAGVVARRTVEVGQQVAAGTPLMAVVPLTDVWVDANFKEVQLKRMRIGQPVTLLSDIYGGGFQYHGKLAGLSAGSGNAFALLPPQNASGNWIKIVQRVPVRIVLDPADLKSHPLRIGLSMTAVVDVRETAGTLIAGSLRNEPLPSLPSRSDDPTVPRRIAGIISANAGSTNTPAGPQIDP